MADIKKIEETKKSYEFRTLCAEDIFPLATLISKLGIKDVANCFGDENVKNAMQKKYEDEEEEKRIVGIQVITSVLGLVLKNFPNAKSEIYTLLSASTGIKIDELKTMGLSEFTEMIIDYFKQEGMIDFFKVALKYLNLE